MRTVNVESLLCHLAGLLYWRSNLCIVEDVHKALFECNEHLGLSLIDLVTTHSFDAAGMASLPMVI